MGDHDELLARADGFTQPGNEVELGRMLPQVVPLIRGLAAALRAALAAQPQLTDLTAALVEYDRLHDAFMNDTAEDVETAVRLTAPLPKAKDTVIAAAREVVAGSVTPTEDNDE